jgi:integrase
MRARVALGHDPAGEKQERKQESVRKIEEKKLRVTMGQLADEYFAVMILGRWKHPNIVRARIGNDIKPNIGHLPIGDVNPQHIDAMLKAIVKRGAPTMANDALRWTKKMFDYAMRRGMCQFNPAAPFSTADAGGKEESRDRWLTREELAALFAAMRGAKGWNVLNTLTVRLLLLLACRRVELIAAPVAEFDLGRAVWYLPGERTKTGKAIDIPLPRQAVESLRALVSMNGGSAWLLPARKMQERMTPHIDLNTVGAALNKWIRPALRQQGIPDFTVHDFRRSARTHLAALGVTSDIAERCLNHAVKGVEGIYNRHDFFDERRVALQQWADLLDRCERGGA